MASIVPPLLPRFFSRDILETKENFEIENVSLSLKANQCIAINVGRGLIEEERERSRIVVFFLFFPCPLLTTLIVRNSEGF